MCAPIEAVWASAYTIPTDAPEGDGTLEWDSTTLVVVEITAGGKTGLGYTYSDGSIVHLIEQKLAAELKGQDALNVIAARLSMQRLVRNLGRQGLVAMAIPAIDIALWDLKAKLLDLSLTALLSSVRDSVPIYGSGGFTTYDDGMLREQLGGWVERDRCKWVKMKIGAHPDDDVRRVREARSAIGTAGLMVDANGAYTAKQALHHAEAFAEEGVVWFEEPVSSDDLDGLHLLSRHVSSSIEIAAGEYGFTLDYFQRALTASAVDVMQADATRCGGITGWLMVAALCETYHIDLSAHCAPALHLHVACAVPRFRHIEWFHDHVRIERMLFDGAPSPRDGLIYPDKCCHGLGLTFRHADAKRYLTS